MNAPGPDDLAPPRGILGLPGRLPFTVRRFAPSADWEWCLERFWVSSWDLPEDRAAITGILPHPNINVTLESGDLVVTGVAAGVFSRRLVGHDSVFGAKFNPGTFRLLSTAPVRALSGTGQSAAGVLPDHGDLQRSLVDAADDDARSQVFESYLSGQSLQSTPTVELIGQAVRLLVWDTEIIRVRQVAARCAVSERTLQRLFVDYVGVTPGWVLRRGRLHAAADRVIRLAATGRDDGYAAVAAEFGYADQAHFIRDFRKILGVPPAGWAAQLVREEPRS